MSDFLKVGYKLLHDMRYEKRRTSVSFQVNLCVKECKIGGNLKIDTAWVDGETSGRLQANTI